MAHVDYRATTEVISSGFRAHRRPRSDSFSGPQYGRRSERLDPDQLALGLEDLETDKACAETAQEPPVQPKDRKPRRKPLPEHLPREEVVLDAAPEACPCCGGVLHTIGESISEMLNWVPAQLRVIRIRRPKYGHQAAAPERPIAGGLATRRCSRRSWSASIAITRHCTGNRKSLRATGLSSIARRWPDGLAAHAGGSTRCARMSLHRYLFADDTPIPVLDPGRGGTKTGRLWVYARDQRPWSGSAPPAAIFVFAPDRKSERPAAHLEQFSGVLHVDGYAGFERLTARGNIILAAWMHTRAAQVLRTLGSNRLAHCVPSSADRKIGHCTPPGHGRLNARSASISTFA